MDFARVLDTVTGFLEDQGFRHALAGALGLQAYGLARLTYDVDLVTEAGSRPGLVSFLESLGYETLHVSEGFSNHLHPDPAWGRIDLIYVNGETGRMLFAGCRTLESPLGRAVLVPRPEHLAAMKVHAMKNDPSRALQDMADVQYLLRLPGVDREEIRGYFDRAGLGGEFREIERRL